MGCAGLFRRAAVGTRGPRAARRSVCRRACDATRAFPNSFPAVVCAQGSLVCRPAAPVGPASPEELFQAARWR
eukprot:8225560-Lingulodinium_polyedra.AAC.1